MWDASSILRNYEVHTGRVLTREELDSGCLSGKLTDADYDLTTSVSVLFNSLPQLTASSSLKGENFLILCICNVCNNSCLFDFIVLAPRLFQGFCAHCYTRFLYYRPRTCLNDVATSM